MKVFSDEWAEAYVKALNDNANYKAAASWWTGDFMFVIFYPLILTLDH
ncbi:MAG: hypothetical protein ACTSO6_03815 [Promethearchaeota archaeon]